MGSIDSEVPLAYQSTYAASKAAVLSLGRSVQQELRHAGYNRSIRIVTVMPWAVDTPWWPHAANYSGHAPRMAMMDDPSKIIEALLYVSLHPRPEVPVGWKAQASYSTHGIFPDAVEAISANIQRAELAKGAPAAATSGTLHHPVEQGQGVEGGVRARMKAEDQELKGQRP
jgi:short-subunit dehydrogenase